MLFCDSTGVVGLSSSNVHDVNTVEPQKSKLRIARLFILNLGGILDRHLAACAIHASTDVFRALIAGYGNNLRHCALDGNIATLTFLTAADTCSLVTTFSRDLTTINRDIATR